MNCDVALDIWFANVPIEGVLVLSWPRKKFVGIVKHRLELPSFPCCPESDQRKPISSDLWPLDSLKSRLGTVISANQDPPQIHHYVQISRRREGHRDFRSSLEYRPRRWRSQRHSKCQDSRCSVGVPSEWRRSKAHVRF